MRYLHILAALTVIMGDGSAQATIIETGSYGPEFTSGSGSVELGPGR